MKQIYLMIVLCLVIAQTSFAQDKLSALFSKLDGNDNVTQVTITKSMLDMMPKTGSSNNALNMNGVDVKDIVNKLNQIDIFTSKDVDTKKMMIKETKEYFNGNGNGKDYIILMRVKDKKDDVVFYGKKDGNFFTSLIMVVNQEDDCTLIRISGKFTPQDIQDVTNASKTKQEKTE